MVQLWRIGTDTKTYTADEITGKGAEKHGGRWNRAGSAVLYTSPTIALACLETLVHLNSGGLPLNRFLVKISVPDPVWAAREIASANDLEVGWSAVPEGKVSLDFGDAWIAKGSSALLEIPSVIIPEESNVLINPAHPAAKTIEAKKLRPWTYDLRLVQRGSAVKSGARRA